MTACKLPKDITTVQSHAPVQQEQQGFLAKHNFGSESQVADELLQSMLHADPDS